MDKYAVFVWAAYGVALGLLGLTTIGVLMRLASAHRRLKALEAEDEA